MLTSRRRSVDLDGDARASDGSGYMRLHRPVTRGVAAVPASSDDDGEAEPGRMGSRTTSARQASAKSRHAAARLATRTQCLSTFRDTLRNNPGPLLRTWFAYFDRGQLGRVGHKEFRAGMQALQYQGDIDMLWKEINYDNSDELFFDEVDQEQGMLWSNFRRWCGGKFDGPKDMFRELKRAAAAASSSPKDGGNTLTMTLLAQQRAPKDILSEQETTVALESLGWELGDPATIFAVMDLSGEGAVSIRDMKWMELEARRSQMKLNAMKQAQRMSEKKARTKRMCAVALHDFKLMLQRQYGPLFRAWRRVLDQDGSMTLQRAELFKVCRQIRWGGNMRTLWKALDHDGSGGTTFEELDPHGAKLLAEFRGWAISVWGSPFAGALFRDFDRLCRKKLSYGEFAQACAVRGFGADKAKSVSVSLDWRAHRYLLEDDLQVLDVWRPPDWLIAASNEAAADEYKACLLRKYGHYVRAWRQAMDKDNSNSCTWQEFCDAAKRIKFTGDIAGAWVSLDTDLSGYISLREIDANSHKLFMHFKLWAESEFGGCRIAFKAMDTDKSNSLNYREFRSACRSYGYKGDIQALFASLDQHGNKHTLTLEEVAFLDDWESTEDEPLTGLTVEELELAALSAAVDPTPQRVDYPPSETPGPGDYNVDEALGLIAAPPWTPLARHNGCYSFGPPRPKPSRKASKATEGQGVKAGAEAIRGGGDAATPRATPSPLSPSPTGEGWTSASLQTTRSTAAGPADYDPDELPTSLRRRKPAWTFGDPGGPPPQELWIPRGMVPKSLLVPLRRSISIQAAAAAANTTGAGGTGDGARGRSIDGRSTRNSISMTRGSLFAGSNNNSGRSSNDNSNNSNSNSGGAGGAGGGEASPTGHYQRPRRSTNTTFPVSLRHDEATTAGA